MSRIDFDHIAAVLEQAGLRDAAAAHRAIALGADPGEALGLLRGPGQRMRANELKRLRRNQLLFETAKTFFSDFPPLQQSIRISQGLRSYHARGWQRDRDKDECPTRLSGKVEEMYWRILKEVDHPPLSWQHTNRVLLDCARNTP